MLRGWWACDACDTPFMPSVRSAQGKLLRAAQALPASALRWSTLQRALETAVDVATDKARTFTGFRRSLGLPTQRTPLQVATQDALDAFDVLMAQEPGLPAVLEERARQDAKWGGPTHDDDHLLGDWLTHIEQRLQLLHLIVLTCDDQGVFHGNADLDGGGIDGGLTLTLDADEHTVSKLWIELAALALAALNSHTRQYGPDYRNGPSAGGGSSYQGDAGDAGGHTGGAGEPQSRRDPAS